MSRGRQRHHAVTVSIGAALMPGDANGDGTVNINDLSKVLTNYDKTGKRGPTATSTATAP